VVFAIFEVLLVVLNNKLKLRSLFLHNYSVNAFPIHNELIVFSQKLLLGVPISVFRMTLFSFFHSVSINCYNLGC
jgi:hypothetical protein